MAFVESYVVTDPNGGTTRVSGLDDSIRQFKRAMKERVESLVVSIDADPWVLKTGTVLNAPVVAGGMTVTGTSALAAVTATTGTFTTSVQVGATGNFGWVGRSSLTSPSDAVITLFNSGGSTFDRLQFGGVTALFPALKRDGAAIDVVLADNTAFATLNAGTLTAQTGGISVVAGNLVVSSGTTSLQTLTVASAATMNTIASSVTSGSVFDAIGATTSESYGRFITTGALLAWGVESSVGGAIASGGSAYSGIFGTFNARSLHLVTNSVVRATINSAGATTLNGALTVSGATALQTLTSTTLAVSGAATVVDSVTVSSATTAVLAMDAPSSTYVLQRISSANIWAFGPNANGGGNAWDLYNYTAGNSSISVDPTTSRVSLPIQALAGTLPSGATSKLVASDGTARSANGLSLGSVLAFTSTCASGAVGTQVGSENILKATTSGVSSYYALRGYVWAAHTAGTLNNAHAVHGFAEAGGIGGTTTKLSALSGQVFVAAGATATNAYGLRVVAGVHSGTTVNNYGIWVDDMTGGTTLNYAIKTKGGRIGFENLPTSSAGLVAGDLWLNAGAIAIMP